MRLLAFADVHLDAAFAWATPAVAAARRGAVRRSLSRICDLAAELEVDALCSAGDLYEQELFTPDTVGFLRSEFARIAGIRVILAPGNHDWYGPSSIYRQATWSTNVHVFTDDRLRPLPLTEGFTLWGAAHRAPAGTAGFLDGFEVGPAGGVHLALFHGSEQGELVFEGAGKKPHAPFRASQIASTGLRHAIVGHFHTPRDAPTHTYPGNPEPLSFGETGARGAVLITVGPEGQVTRERFDVAVSQVNDVSVSLDGVEHSGEVRARVAASLAGLKGTVRVTLVGEVGPDVDLGAAGLVDVAPHLEAIVLRVGAVTVAYDLEALAGERTVRGQFVRDVQAATDLTAEQRRRVLITGLRALDGRRDLDVPAFDGSSLAAAPEVS